MKKIILITYFLFLTTSSFTQENLNPSDTDNDNSIKLPVNVFDKFTFNKKANPYIKIAIYVSGPAFMLIYGFSTWQWNAGESFSLKPQTYKGAHAINGAADKFGHLYSNYTGKRFFSFLFRAAGSSPLRANIEGIILTEITSFGGEIGDGFSNKYGFDPYDALFNQMGILLGAILDFSPFLDRIFAYKLEYYPSKQMRAKFDIIDHHDFATDYNGEKFILSTKFGGIPYLSLTPLRYFNFDIGYYTRGYRNNSYEGKTYYKSRTRHLFIGFSANFSIAFGDALPVGYISSSLQSFFNYFHPKWDLEVKDWVLSDIPLED